MCPCVLSQYQNLNNNVFLKHTKIKKALLRLAEIDFSVKVKPEIVVDCIHLVTAACV